MQWPIDVTHSTLITVSVPGVLEANFVEPAHDKQGFERTNVLQRLEQRLVGIQKDFWFVIFPRHVILVS